jgi:hypothetical protein
MSPLLIPRSTGYRGYSVTSCCRWALPKLDVADSLSYRRAEQLQGRQEPRKVLGWKPIDCSTVMQRLVPSITTSPIERAHLRSRRAAPTRTVALRCPSPLHGAVTKLAPWRTVGCRQTVPVRGSTFARCGLGAGDQGLPGTVSGHAVPPLRRVFPTRGDAVSPESRRLLKSAAR